jgi:hypothetical protein
MVPTRQHLETIQAAVAVNLRLEPEHKLGPAHSLPQVLDQFIARIEIWRIAVWRLH